MEVGYSENPSLLYFVRIWEKSEP